MKTFLEVSAEYIKPVAVVADKKKFSFYYIQNIVKTYRKVKYKKNPKG